MGAVFELLLREDDAGDGDGDKGGAPVPFGADGGVVVAGKPVAGRLWVGVPAGGWVGEGLEPPINWPGPISGLSKERRCENEREKKMERRIPTTGGYRVNLIPIIPQLTCNVSSCRKI